MFDCEILPGQTLSPFAQRHGSHLYVAVWVLVSPHVNRIIGLVFSLNGNVLKFLIMHLMNHCTVDLDQMLHTNVYSQFFFGCNVNVRFRFLCTELYNQTKLRTDELQRETNLTA